MPPSNPSTGSTAAGPKASSARCRRRSSRRSTTIGSRRHRWPLPNYPSHHKTRGGSHGPLRVAPVRPPLCGPDRVCGSRSRDVAVATEVNLPPYFAVTGVATGEGAPAAGAAVGVAWTPAAVKGVGAGGATDGEQPTIPKVATPSTLAPLPQSMRRGLRRRADLWLFIAFVFSFSLSPGHIAPEPVGWRPRRPGDAHTSIR
jgi:hypothetical protein